MVTSLPLGVQVLELVPGGQGRVIALGDAVTALTTGGTFGGGGNPLALRRPIQN